MGNFNLYANRVGSVSILIGLSIATTIFFKSCRFSIQLKGQQEILKKIYGNYGTIIDSFCTTLILEVYGYICWKPHPPGGYNNGLNVFTCLVGVAFVVLYLLRLEKWRF